MANIDQIKQKYKEKITGNWKPFFDEFLESKQFETILKTLKEKLQQGETFEPHPSDIFRVFEECAFEKTKVVMLSMDPYPKKGVANGIAFCCGKTGVVQPSLKFILEAIKEEIGEVHAETDLTSWANQGVLLLNCALTVRTGAPDSHMLLWRPFTEALLNYITFHKPGLVYIFLGNKAKAWMKSVPDNNIKLFATHPASTVYQKSRLWSSEGIFKKTNEHLISIGEQPIIW
jgi:uracil-DNA glycosylase